MPFYSAFMLWNCLKLFTFDTRKHCTLQSTLSRIVWRIWIVCLYIHFPRPSSFILIRYKYQSAILLCHEITQEECLILLSGVAQSSPLVFNESTFNQHLLGDSQIRLVISYRRCFEPYPCWTPRGFNLAGVWT